MVKCIIPSYLTKLYILLGLEFIFVSWPLFLKTFHENIPYPLYNFRESDVSTNWYYLKNWHHFSLCTSLINPIKLPPRTCRTILTQKIITIIKIIHYIRFWKKGRLIAIIIQTFWFEDFKGLTIEWHIQKSKICIYHGQNVRWDDYFCQTFSTPFYLKLQKKFGTPNIHNAECFRPPINYPENVLYPGRNSPDRVCKLRNERPLRSTFPRNRL